MTIRGVGISAGLAPGARATATPGGSPYTYQNTSGRAQLVLVSGGTVTTISFSRDGTQFDLVGLLAGSFLLMPGDYLKVVYAVAPNVFIYPS